MSLIGIGLSSHYQSDLWHLGGQQQILSTSPSLQPALLLCPSCAAGYSFLFLQFSAFDWPLSLGDHCRTVLAMLLGFLQSKCPIHFWHFLFLFCFAFFYFFFAIMVSISSSSRWAGRSLLFIVQHSKYVNITASYNSKFSLLNIKDLL